MMALATYLGLVAGSRVIQAGLAGAWSQPVNERSAYPDRIAVDHVLLDL